MVRVEFLGPIGKAAIEADIENLAQLSEILQADDEIKHWLGNCAVAVNDKLVSSKNITLKNGDKVSLLPPVCGG